MKFPTKCYSCSSKSPTFASILFAQASDASSLTTKEAIKADNSPTSANEDQYEKIRHLCKYSIIRGFFHEYWKIQGKL